MLNPWPFLGQKRTEYFVAPGGYFCRRAHGAMNMGSLWKRILGRPQGKIWCHREKIWDAQGTL